MHTAASEKWDARSWDRIHLLVHELAELRDEFARLDPVYAARIDAMLVRFYADLEQDGPDPEEAA